MTNEEAVRFNQSAKGDDGFSIRLDYRARRGVALVIRKKYLVTCLTKWILAFGDIE